MIKRCLRTYCQKSVYDTVEMFKDSMSRMSSPAMILTSGIKECTKANKENYNRNAIPNLHGMTLGSVSSLSIQPFPLLQFNLHLPSYTSSSLHEFKYLALHLLPATPRAAQLGRTFASGVKTTRTKFIPDNVNVKDDGEVFHEMTTPFEKLHESHDWFYHCIEEDAIKIPVLKESERVFICKAENHMIVHDHESWVVKVLEILTPNEKYLHSKTGGLIYFNRSFHQVGQSLRD